MKCIKIGIFGFGRTGKTVVHEFIKDEMYQVAWVVRKSSSDNNKFASQLLDLETESGVIFSTDQMTEDFFRDNPVDLLIDFSDTSGVRYYQWAADQGISIISAVSQYDAEDMALLHSLARKVPVLYSPNITLGINVLMAASQILHKIAPQADIAIVEEHFRDKAEISGTAKKIANSLDVNHDKICSIRAGGIIGRHEIIFGLPNQTIRLIHDSISRAAFGQGAIFASKYLLGKSKGLYTMDHAITEMFREHLPAY